jgi:hypothetical protein
MSRSWRDGYLSLQLGWSAGLLAVVLLAARSLGGSSSPSQPSRSSSSPGGSSSTGSLAQVPEVAAQLQPSVVTVLVRGRRSG